MKKNKKIIICSLIIISLISLICVFVFNKNNISDKTKITEKPAVNVKNVQQKKSVTNSKSEKQVYKDETVKEISNELAETKLPFSSVIKISELPENIKGAIKNTEEEYNVLYYIKDKDKAILLVETSEECPRHEIGYIEIDTITGNQTQKYFENLISKKGDNESWEYEEGTKRPLKHVITNSKGNVEYTEEWNYKENEPIKYVLKNGNDKVISIKKETLDNEMTMRREHIIYDNDGKIKVNVSSIYNGPDMTSFTYYDASNTDDSETIVSEYSQDGVKIKETVYSYNYKVKNLYEAEYENGVLKEIQTSSPEDTESSTSDE